MTGSPKGPLQKKLQCCVAFNGRVSELLKLFCRKCIPTRKTEFELKKLKITGPSLHIMPVFMPCEHGRTKPLQNAKNWPASAYPWSIDIKKEPALALAQTYSISPSSSWPEAPSTKSPAGGICNWFPSLTQPWCWKAPASADSFGVALLLQLYAVL